MKHIVCLSVLSIALLGAINHAYGQTVQVTCEKTKANDSLFITVIKPTNVKPGTLRVVASQKKYDESDTLFFPIIDSSNFFIITIPEEYRRENLDIQASFYPKIFETSGMVLSQIPDETINALVLTNNQKIFNKEIKLTEDKQFRLPGLIFENKASVIFNYKSASQKKEKPNIVIQQTPTLKNFTERTFSDKIVFVPEDTIPKIVEDTTAKKNTVGSQSSKKQKKREKGTLDEVTITAVKKTRAEKFNEKYTTALFSDINERIIDCMDNKSMQSYPNCLSFLTSQIPGLTVRVNQFGENEIFMRGKEVNAFFIDEIQVDLQQILDMNMANISIIKSFPPPFFGASGGTGDGGAIAVYTRVGEFKTGTSRGDNKWLFSLKGYTPSIHKLYSDDAQ